MDEIKLGTKLTLESLIAARGLSPEKLAKEIGVSAQTIYNWMDGKPIKSTNLIKACIKLQVPTDLFLLSMGYEEEEINKIPKSFQKTITYNID